MPPEGITVLPTLHICIMEVITFFPFLPLFHIIDVHVSKCKHFQFAYIYPERGVFLTIPSTLEIAASFRIRSTEEDGTK